MALASTLAGRATSKPQISMSRLSTATCNPDVSCIHQAFALPTANPPQLGPRLFPTELHWHPPRRSSAEGRDPRTQHEPVIERLIDTAPPCAIPVVAKSNPRRPSRRRKATKGGDTSRKGVNVTGSSPICRAYADEASESTLPANEPGAVIGGDGNAIRPEDGPGACFNSPPTILLCICCIPSLVALAGRPCPLVARHRVPQLGSLRPFPHPTSIPR